jgi:hypothetical protein
MVRSTPWHAVRALALTAVIAFVAGAAGPAGAAHLRRPFTVDIQSAAWLAPDGHSMTVQVLATCPERWTVVEALVQVSQGEDSGQASFPLTCIDQVRMFTVTVPAAAGTFELGEAQASASVVIKRGKTESTQDSEVILVQPAVFVDLGDSAQLESGGGAVTIAVTVACPVGANGQQSFVGISQGETRGRGSYVPICDGSRHTFTVRVQALQGLYVPGAAQALTFADVEHDGMSFSGVDEQQVQIVS